MMHVTLFQCVMDFVVTCVVSPHWPPIPLPPAVVRWCNLPFIGDDDHVDGGDDGWQIPGDMVMMVSF